MLATVGMSMAQDIWSVGYSNNSTTGKKDGRLYKNGSSQLSVSTSSTDYEGVGVVKHTDGVVYWAVNGTTSSSNLAYVYTDTPSTPYLSTGAGSKINALFHRTSLYAAGYYTVDGKKVACTWRNDNSTPEYVMGNSSYDSEALCGMFPHVSGLYTGGYQYTSSSVYHGVIWKNNTVLYEFPNYTKIVGIYYYDGNVYSVGYKYESSKYTVYVYKNGSVLYTLVSETSSSARPYSIYVDSGDTYVCGYYGTPCYVWRNGEVLYEESLGSAGFLTDVFVNSNGVYYVGKNSDDQGLIYKDGEVIYTPNNCTRLNAIYMDPLECSDGDARTLPYFEGFEMGATDWECWTKVDVDNNNGGSHFMPFWDRSRGSGSASAYEGEYSAYHGWGVNAQEGWLISPPLFLQPGRDYTRLNFWSNELNTSYNDYRGVWVSTSGTSTSSFTEVYSVPSPSSSWHQITVDLSAYQGQTVYLAFKDTGTNEIGWKVDNVNVYESWSPCGNDITEFPYEQHFDYNPFYSTCWYLLDNDHTGGLKCWQYDSSNECVMHPYGQNNGVCQEGWMISQRMQLTAGMNYTLSFRTKSVSSGSDKKNSVWIALDQTGVPDPADYTQIWEETDYSSSWGERTIDLSSYAGHTVNIAFKYEGTYAHHWYIDDFVVTAALPQYNINVEANNASWGSVEGGGTFEQGESVTITATPNTGYEFIKWTKDGSEVSNNASYTFTVTENATYVAVFGEPAVTYYDIYTSASPATAGEVTGGGTYAEGTEVTLVASANTGWHFVRWQDNNTDNPRTITVNGDATYTAYFQADIYALTVTASPVEGGTATGGGTYPYGSVVALNAIPKTGYEFLNWNDGVTTASRNVTVVGNASYVAHFIDTTTTVYNVTALANDPTLGEVTGGGSYPEGAEVTLTASAFGSAVFVRWNDNNTENPRVITVTGDVTYTAYFEVPTMYAITVVSQNPDMGSVSGGGNFPMGAEVTIQANPFGGYYFDGWTDNSYDNPRTITVTGDATYTAKFSAQQSQTFTLTTTCNPTQGYVDGSGNYPAGTVVTVTATPYDGYAFDHWNDGNTDNPRAVTVDNNMTLVAFFTSTGVDENGESVLGLYPNPAKEMVRIEGIATNSEVEFYNALGMLVKTVNANAGQEINVSDLAAGLYLIRCGSQTIRFVKE